MLYNTTCDNKQKSPPSADFIICPLNIISQSDIKTTFSLKKHEILYQYDHYKYNIIHQIKWSAKLLNI